ncbi:MAG: APC family permease [Rhodococcus fascians]|uniref:APC family permease n=1 Tax=Nocardiaceae TaxID=85025 RepID=UPI000380EDDB|nr:MULTISPECIES: APC family permease [Rhodococcus]OZD07612.1 APC family permease [Rhodococcus sp. 06-156-4C]OZD17178.1 APC family permease [Rhodococcus sp. 06-156-3C]OZD18516.1 APC family permease [Rhodococcus sp. 06-156-4a]OZD28284.1 APC family permease [Rhodococcus sp. 06-156-3]OZD29947.1 APC family permease [Rhodococcus sp. 06-156-3b]
MSALEHAITASFAAREPERPALSPLRALGRRQLSGVEVFAQSVATTAPAASMVILPLTMLTHETMLAGVLTILAATIVVSLIAFCVSQFTRRFSSSGGLYSFAVKGSGPRGALTVGAAMLCKYCASGAMTLYFGGQAVRTVLHELGVPTGGILGIAAVHGVIAAAMLGCLLRGVRFAATAILVVEVCSLLFITALLVFPSSGPVEIEPSGAPNGLMIVALGAMFSLAGFESATFFAPEAKRPLVNVTRTVLLTPIICGALFTFAAWAVWSGRGGVLVDAYQHGTSTGIDAWLVVALNLGLSFSWLASAMASSNAASRLLYTMGVENVVTRRVARVHRVFRTPHVALWIVVGLVVGLGSLLAIAAGIPIFDNFRFLDDVRLLARAAVIVGYAVASVAAVAFLRRIGELTTPVVCAGVLACASGTAILANLLFTVGVQQNITLLVMLGLLGASGLAWRAVLHHRRPRSLDAVGVFDSAESHDVLPGAVTYGENSRGAVALVKSPASESR